MKRLVILAGAALWGAAVSAATLPIYTQSTPVFFGDLPPRVDATAFVNDSIFQVDAFQAGLSELPFETFNTRFFTNTPSGEMEAYPGFRFDYKTGTTRRPMSWWVNRGSIVGDPLLSVSASNIVSEGALESGASGLVRLSGGDIDLDFIGVRAGNREGQIFSGGQNLVGQPFFTPAPGVTDQYWGVGSNNVFQGTGAAVPINGSNFFVPLSSSPLHGVQQFVFGRYASNTAQVPSFLSGSRVFEAFAYTNRIDSTSAVVQVAFVATNPDQPDLSTRIAFYPGGTARRGGQNVAVGFVTSDFDIANNTFVTNELWVVDSLAFQTNSTLFRPLVGGTRRPGNYEVTRTAPVSLPAFAGTNVIGANTPYSPDLLYRISYFSNEVNMIYSAYGATLSASGATNTSVGSVAGQPTNFPGRIEIIGDRVSLDETRLRAESTVVIKARNLVNNHVARVDAPFVSLDLATTESQMVVSNLAPSDVRRLYGNLYLWSAIWRNFETNAASGDVHQTDFHVFMIEADLRSVVPVQIYELGLAAPLLVIADNLNVSRSVRLEADTVCVEGGLSLPAGVPWAASNMVDVVNLTNRGVITNFSAAFYGTDRSQPYSNIVNFGTNSAVAQFIRTRNFENSGATVARGGSIRLDSVTTSLLGSPATVGTEVVTNFIPIATPPFFTSLVVTNVITNHYGARLDASGNVEITARNLVASNSFIRAGSLTPGLLSLNVTNQLVDGGPGQTNHWSATAGVDVRRRPTTSDLLHTYLTSYAPPNRQAVHTWAGLDRGASITGFSNNLALGKLTLDGANGTRFRFTGAGGAGVRSNALYVDYLELRNNALNYTTDVLSVDPGMIVYFANASVSALKLTNAAGGRIRWISDYTGPLSSTNLTYFFTNGMTVTSNVYTFNIALVTSKDLDSDGDGLVNAEDPRPIPVPEDAMLSISLSPAAAPVVRLNWTAFPHTRSYLEFRSVSGGAWQTLTQHQQGETAAPVMIVDPVLPGQPNRIYRLRVEPAD
ncbi:MAG TPA: hypothetical protein VNO52_00985 [Methylomirabilota bacterium]|nr:hypothetical protein [Methylomirabilota bacterium]